MFHTVWVGWMEAALSGNRRVWLLAGVALGFLGVLASAAAMYFMIVWKVYQPTQTFQFVALLGYAGMVVCMLFARRS